MTEDNKISISGAKFIFVLIIIIISVILVQRWIGGVVNSDENIIVAGVVEKSSLIVHR